MTLKRVKPGQIKIISGGQTGVDRAALDFAIQNSLEHGGWCPRGRLAEDGIIPPVYHLRETDSAEYEERTEKNVLDSDATVIVTREKELSAAQLSQKPLPNNMVARCSWFAKRTARYMEQLPFQNS